MAVNLVGRLGVGRGAGAAGAVVRPVPGRPLGGRAGPADRAQHRGPRRLRGVDARATSATSPSTPRCGAGSASGRRRCAARGSPSARRDDGRRSRAAARRRHRGAGRAAGRAGRRARPRRDRRRRPAPAGAHRGPLGRAALGGGLPDAGGPHWAGCGCRAHQPPRARRCAATWRRRCATPASSPRRARGAAARARAPPTTTELATLRRALRAHPCHGCDDREAHARWAERHARLERETEQLRQKVRATTHIAGAARSTGSVPCWASAATSPATARA